MAVAKTLLVIGMLILVGCGSLFSKKGATDADDYQKAAISPLITTPEGSHNPVFEPLYPIPELSENARPIEKGKFVLDPPVALPVIWDEERIKIASNQQKSWVSINVAPSLAWESVLGFWNEQGIPLVYKNARRGIMETEWVVLDKAHGKIFGRGEIGSELAPSKVKIRVHIERGDFPDMTNVYLMQKYSSGGEAELPDAATIDWSAPQLFDHVQTPLAELASYLKTNQQPPTSISLAAQSTSVEQLTEIVQRSGLNMLLLRKDFNHSWVSIGEALKRGKFPLEDLDRSQSLFYLELRDSEKNKSELLEQLLQKDELSKNLFGDYKLQLKLIEEGENILVRVENSQGLPTVNEVSAVILKRLKEYIS